MPSRSLPPAILRAVAALYGISAPPVANARVLNWAAATCCPTPSPIPKPAVGVDLSVQQIEAGQSIVKAMGLKNLTCAR